MNYVGRLKKIFLEVPPDWEGAKAILNQQVFSSETLMEVAVDAINNCCCEYREAGRQNTGNVRIEALHSGYIYQVIDLLLQYGLNPNDEFDHVNLMWNSQYIDAPNIGASVLRLLLEHGGNPNYKPLDESETLFEYVAFKVGFDDLDEDYKHIVQCWMVLMAFGGNYGKSTKPPVEMLNGNDVKIFKEFELFDFWIETLSDKPGQTGYCIMHVYNKNTKEEVARY